MKQIIFLLMISTFGFAQKSEQINYIEIKETPYTFKAVNLINSVPHVFRVRDLNGNAVKEVVGIIPTIEHDGTMLFLNVDDEVGSQIKLIPEEGVNQKQYIIKKESHAVSLRCTKDDIWIPNGHYPYMTASNYNVVIDKSDNLIIPYIYPEDHPTELSYGSRMILGFKEDIQPEEELIFNLDLESRNATYIRFSVEIKSDDKWHTTVGYRTYKQGGLKLEFKNTSNGIADGIRINVMDFTPLPFKVSNLKLIRK